MRSAKRILIIGATGIVGKEVIKELFAEKQHHEIIAAVRNIDRAKTTFSSFPELKYRLFDICNHQTFNGALSNISTIFLLRPPQVSNISKYFSPLIAAIKINGVKEIVFLSVHGAEKSRLIPHNKIERLIQNSEIQYTFLRPTYFMQNLTTSFLVDIKSQNQLYIPAGSAIFNWVDVTDVGKVAANILMHFEKHRNKTYDLTGYENLSFHQVAKIMSSVIGRKITYKSPYPFLFYKYKTKQGMNKKKAIILTLLHYAVRFSKAPHISNTIFEITGDKPVTLEEVVKREKEKLSSKHETGRLYTTRDI